MVVEIISLETSQAHFCASEGTLKFVFKNKTALFIHLHHVK